MCHFGSVPQALPEVAGDEHTGPHGLAKGSVLAAQASPCTIKYGMVRGDVLVFHRAL